MIKDRIKDGWIKLEPFTPENVQPNSVDILIDDQILVLQDKIVNIKQKANFKKEIISKDGYTLYPEKFYLFRSKEKITLNHRVWSKVEGKSSNARNGLNCNYQGGVIDRGYSGYITLTVTVHHPVVIYPDLKIAQLIFFEINDYPPYVTYQGKYQDNNEIQQSKTFEEYKQKDTLVVKRGRKKQQLNFIERKTLFGKTNTVITNHYDQKCRSRRYKRELKQNQ